MDTPEQTPQERFKQELGINDLDSVAEGFLEKEQARRGEERESDLKLKEAVEGEEGESTEETAEATASEEAGTGEGEGEGEEETEGEGEETTEEELMVDVIVDGKVETRTVDEVIKGYQRQEDYSRKTAALADERKQLEQQRAVQIQQGQQYMAQLESAVQHLQSQIQTDSSPDALRQIAELEETDPGKAALLRQKMEERRTLAAQAQAYQRQMQEYQMAQAVPRERAALAQANEEFAKDFNTTYESVGKWALSPEGGGLSPAEWNGIFDHRHVLIVQKAMKYDEATRKKAPQVARKLAAKKPRVLRPGTNQASGDTQTTELREAMADLKERGDQQSAMRAFLARERLRKARVRETSPR